jgi:uncharacterized membrane protein YedE/YeeE
MSIGTILLIILVVALLGGFSGFGGGPFYGTGYYGGGGLGLVLIVVLILVVTGRIDAASEEATNHPHWVHVARLGFLLHSNLEQIGPAPVVLR